jgi:ankyrin repeat protein
MQVTFDRLSLSNLNMFFFCVFVCVQSNAMAEARLLDAAFSGDCKALRSYIKKGYNCKARQRESPCSSLLHLAAGLACTDCDKASIIQSLVKGGADVDARDDAGLTPLLISVSQAHGHSACSALLLVGADVLAVCNNQKTALHWAAGNGSTDLVSVLLKAGVSASSLCREKLLPLHYLCFRGTSDCEVRRTFFAPIAHTVLRNSLSEGDPVLKAAYILAICRRSCNLVWVMEEWIC